MQGIRIHLLARADDAGSCHTANEAIMECVEAGLALNVGVMACCPFLDEVASMLTERKDVCVGLHATINAEWDAVKWGPVLPPERVPTLVDANGHLHPTPNVTHEHGGKAEEVVAEIEAQFARARAVGLKIAYLDEHMGFSWLPGVRERLDALMQREGLLHGGRGYDHLPPSPWRFDDRADDLIARLEAAGPGTYLIVAHPGHDTAEMRRLGHAGLAPGQVAREREGDTRMLTADKVLEYCGHHGVAPTRFTDARPGRRG
ncbi:MAG: ChbG/HpnK family deacetylase [Planctomycetes bacterium]|nr:ChbG/HpnK family deacetylase [Planctomycetota bacterium]